MRTALLALPIAAACGYGPTMYDYEVRLVVGIEPQVVPAAAFVEPPAWVSLRGLAADVAYPLASTGAELRVDSPFVPVQLATAYDPWWIDAPGALVPGALAVRLTPSGVTEREPPPLQDFSGRFSLIVAGETQTVEIEIGVSPELEPCGYDPYEAMPAEVRPAATLDGFPTCVDGTACIPRGTRVDPDERTILIAPFRIFARVQRYCAVSAG